MKTKRLKESIRATVCMAGYIIISYQLDQREFSYQYALYVQVVRGRHFNKILVYLVNSSHVFMTEC